MKRTLILSATLLALAACSTNDRLLAPDHEAARLISPEKPRSTPKGSGVDPVCGAPLDEAYDTWHTTYRGSEFSFDSASCKRQFEEDPDLYSASVR